MDLENVAIMRLREGAEISKHYYDKPLMLCYSGGKATQHANGLEVYHWWMQDGVLPGQLSFDGEDW